MSEKAYKKIRVVGCSVQNMEKAIEIAVAKTTDGHHGNGWFEVVEMRGAITDGKVTEWQATVDIAAKVD